MSERKCCPNDNPAPICFEEDVAGFIINGCCGPCPTMTVCEGPLPAPCATPPCADPIPNASSLIRNDQGWHVTFCWGQDGPTSVLMVGTWEVCVHLHRVDQTAQITKCVKVTHVPKCPHCYMATVSFAPNEVPDGLYEIFGSVGFEVPGPAYAAISGMAYGPVLKVYSAQ
jgi:hypothetical protein